MSLLGGTFDWVVNATHLAHFRDRHTPDADWVDQAGTFRDQASSGNGALPHWKLNVGWQWRTETMLIAHTVHYIGSIDEEIPGGHGIRTIKPWLVHDVQARLFGAQSKWVDVSFGVDNVFDKNATLRSRRVQRQLRRTYLRHHGPIPVSAPLPQHSLKPRVNITRSSRRPFRLLGHCAFRRTTGPDRVDRVLAVSCG